MARKVNRAVSDKKTPTAVPKTKAKRDDNKATFRSPHAGLQVIVKKCERVDYGAGTYTVVPPEIAEFENKGSYGEYVCDPEVAEVLRQKAADRKERGLLAKYVEV